MARCSFNAVLSLYIFEYFKARPSITCHDVFAATNMDYKLTVLCAFIAGCLLFTSASAARSKISTISCRKTQNTTVITCCTPLSLCFSLYPPVSLSHSLTVSQSHCLSVSLSHCLTVSQQSHCLSVPICLSVCMRISSYCSQLLVILLTEVVTLHVVSALIYVLLYRVIGCYICLWFCVFDPDLYNLRKCSCIFVPYLYSSR